MLKEQRGGTRTASTSATKMPRGEAVQRVVNPCNAAQRIKVLRARIKAAQDALAQNQRGRGRRRRGSEQNGLRRKVALSAEIKALQKELASVAPQRRLRSERDEVAVNDIANTPIIVDGIELTDDMRKIEEVRRGVGGPGHAAR